MDDSLPVEAFESPLCALCHRTLSSENNQIDLDSVSISICGDCKFLFLEDNNNTTPSQHIPPPRITPRIRLTRYNTNSSESIEEIFSRQLSTAVNLNPTSDTNTSSRTTPNGSRRWRRIVSDTESEGFGSVYSENDQIDLDSYGGDSDASVDVHSFLGGDSDTDIDPMHTGLNLNQWSSDEEDNEWEDGENTLGSLMTRVQLRRSLTSDGQTAEIEGGIRVRISERRHVNITNPFGTINDDQETSPHVGHSGDYLDSRSFEELLERLAETDNTRRGPPPAALSVVDNLDFVTVNDSDHIGLSCAVCKDGLTVGTVVNRLPCFHLYHSSCIKPWLSSRNTCPLCRFELPTDDMDYENTKQSGSHGLGVQEIEQQEENTSFEEHEAPETTNGCSVGGTGGRRWLFVAAPVVTLVGIGLALWLGNSGCVRSSVSCGSSQRENRSRRWWGLF